MRVENPMMRAGLALLLCCAPFILSAAPPDDYGSIAAPSETTQRPGAVVWMDLLTDDVDKAARFYSEVFGWKFDTSEDGLYAYATLAGKPVAAIAAFEEELGETEGLWLPSVSVPDVDAALSAVKQFGGAVIEPPEELPGRGRYTLVEDPTGAVLMLLRADGGDPAPRETVNSWYWNELWTDDVEVATAFYEGVLGYHTVAVNDAQGGAYNVMGRDQKPHVSVVSAPLPGVDSNWLAYLMVEDVDATARRVLAAGGAVLIPPQKDGFNNDIAIVADPTGGVFALQQRGDK